MTHRDGGPGRGRASNARGPVPPIQEFNNMHIQDRVAVDGSPLTMGALVAMPQPNPMPTNQVEHKESKKVKDGVQAAGMLQAEFPLRKALAEPNTTVYTNHFVVKVDDSKPLYDYNIVGLPRQLSKKTSHKLVQAFIDATPFLAANRAKFTTDACKIISWVKIPNQSPLGVLSGERRVPVAIGLQYVGTVETDLLRKYAEGKIEPTKVRKVLLPWLLMLVDFFSRTSKCRSSW